MSDIICKEFVYILHGLLKTVFQNIWYKAEEKENQLCNLELKFYSI